MLTSYRERFCLNQWFPSFFPDLYRLVGVETRSDTAPAVGCGELYVRPEDTPPFPLKFSWAETSAELVGPCVVCMHDLVVDHLNTIDLFSLHRRKDAVTNGRLAAFEYCLTSREDDDETGELYYRYRAAVWLAPVCEICMCLAQEHTPPTVLAEGTRDSRLIPSLLLRLRPVVLDSAEGKAFGSLAFGRRYAITVTGDSYSTARNAAAYDALRAHCMPLEGERLLTKSAAFT